jgi:RimJ/RimL family protein N-acetyltransferase
MIIRRAGLEDLKEVQDIGARTYIQHYAYLWEEGGVRWYLQKCFGDEVLRAELADPNVEYYIMTAERENVGFLKLILRKALPESNVENALYLEKIYFVKEWTGKGVGRELIKLAFERAAELDRDCVWLTAMDTSDKPIAAYERAGFVFHARTRYDYELIKKELRDAVVLKKILKD